MIKKNANKLYKVNPLYNILIYSKLNKNITSYTT